MKLKATKEFYGSEDGINTKLYNKDEAIETNNKQFADLLIDGGYAKVEDLETKVIVPEETKTKKKSKKESSL